MAASGFDKEAKIAFAKGHLHEALRLYECAREAGKCSESTQFVSKTLANCSLICKQLGDIARAVELADEAVAVDCTWWRAHYRRAEALSLQGDTSAASAFHAAWQLHPALLADIGALQLAFAVNWFDSRDFTELFSLRFARKQIIGHARLSGVVKTAKQALERWHDDMVTDGALRTLQGTLIFLPGMHVCGFSLTNWQVDMVGLGEATLDAAQRQHGNHTLTLCGTSDLRMHSLNIIQSYDTLDVDQNETLVLQLLDEAKLELRCCQLRNQCGICIGALNKARLLLHDVKIHNSACAIAAGESADIICRGVEITDMSIQGMQLQGKVCASIVGSRIKQTKRAAIVALDGTVKLTIEDTIISHACQCYKNVKGAFEIPHGYAAMVIRSHSGATVTTPEVVVRNCKLIDNAGPGFLFKGVSFLVEKTLVASSAAVHLSQNYSVELEANSHGEFVDSFLGDSACNDFFGNGGSLRMRRCAASPVVFRRCELQGGLHLDPHSNEPVIKLPKGPLPGIKRLSDGVDISGMADALIANLGIDKDAANVAKAKDKLVKGVKKQLLAHGDELAKGTLKRLGSEVPGLGSECRLCDSCGENERQLPDRKFLRCAVCKSVYYCSAECQRSGWKLHKFYCHKVTVADSLRSAH